ncbi:MAG: hypothetical protein J6L62_07065 [Clostridia bacterium]|nr:hypothetical protein [Clostridia bacterium]
MKKIVIAIVAVLVCVSAVVLWNLDEILFPYEGEITIVDHISDKIEEKNAVSFWTYYFSDEEPPLYSHFKESYRWDTFAENCEEGKIGEITVARAFDMEAGGQSLDLKKLAFNGESYVLTCDGHFSLDHGETDTFKAEDCYTEYCREQNFKYLKKFDFKFNTDLYGLKEYRFYVLTNIEDLTAEMYERDYLDSDSEVYKDSQLVYVKLGSAQN